jgi:hypothetical protein
MATATANKLMVGDTVLLVKRYGDRPVEVKVTKVTPKGQIRIEGSNDNFKQEQYGRYEYKPVGTGRYDHRIIRHNTTENLKELNENADQAEADKQEKEDRQSRERAERQARLDAEMAEVKALIGSLENVTKHSETLPDGTTISWLNLPVAADYVIRKGTVEVIIVKTKPEKNAFDFATNEYYNGIEMALTVANKSTSSFGSYGTASYKTAEEAMWEAIRQAYHNS